MELFSIIVYIFMLFISSSNCQLVVNVRNNGGDVYRENIDANTTLDTILLEFRKSDGTLVTQFIDGRNEVQIFRVVILPEEELGQTNIQTLCIVQRFTKNEFISSDAMSKLRQKNPSTVRHPEESRPSETYTMDLLLNVAASHVLSTHIVNMCGDASAATYARSADLQLLSQILNRDYAILQTVTQPAAVANLTSCTEIPLDMRSSRQQQPCLCRYDICVGWYPCGLKYCRGKDSAGRIVSYRCGIKTCSRCRKFEFRAADKSHCVWDEPEFQFSEPEIPPSAGEGGPFEPNQNLNGFQTHAVFSDVSPSAPNNAADLRPPAPIAAGDGSKTNAKMDAKSRKNHVLDDDEDG